MENKEEPLRGQREQGNELSEAWQELLGMKAEGGAEMEEGEPQGPGEVPMLANDPWQEIVQVKGNEEFDLQQVHLHLSAQEVERAMRVMQEDSAKESSQ